MEIWIRSARRTRHVNDREGILDDLRYKLFERMLPRAQVTISPDRQVSVGMGADSATYRDKDVNLTNVLPQEIPSCLLLCHATVNQISSNCHDGTK